MNANELRIGNLIYNNYRGHPTLLCKVDITTLRIIEANVVDNYSPIPLDKDWYERFENNNHNIWLELDDDGKYCVVILTEYGDCPRKEIKYVHQWQNAYYFWTDKELTFK